MRGVHLGSERDHVPYVGRVGGGRGEGVERGVAREWKGGQG